MTDNPPPPPDYAALAQRYLDLWQEQVSKLARDPSQLSDIAQTWVKMAVTVMPQQPAGARDPGAPFARPDWPPAAGAPPRHGGVDAADGSVRHRAEPDAAERIAALERRVAALEQQLTKRSRSRKKP